jgi:hypothetical protein
VLDEEHVALHGQEHQPAVGQLGVEVATHVRRHERVGAAVPQVDVRPHVGRREAPRLDEQQL